MPEAQRTYFDWRKVSPAVLRALLSAYFEAFEPSGTRDGELRKLRAMKPGLLARNAGEILGSGSKRRPVKATIMGVLSLTLIERWLPTASKKTVLGLGEDLLMLQSAKMRERKRVALSKKGRKSDYVAYVRKRFREEPDRVEALKALRTAFLSEPNHRTRVIVRRAEPQAKARGGFTIISSKGEDDGWHPRDHQRDAMRGLDALGLPRPGSADVGALVVLPTGAGKTDTAVEWLMNKALAVPEEARLRVLWIAHQQELLVQARNRFAKALARRPAGLELRIEMFHSKASPVTELGAPEVDVALVSRQSFAQAFAEKKRPHLQAFLGRPSVVVVDEVHHAGADTYQKILTVVDEAGESIHGLVGLTATPWPSNPEHYERFHATFPNSVIDADETQLIVEEILARPEIHTVNTSEHIDLEAAERRAAESDDFPKSVLSSLMKRTARTRLVVETVSRHRSVWGRSLIYALRTDHADEIAAGLRRANVGAKSLHSKSTEDRQKVLDWFESTPDAVLVSVGMLTEGVDLPAARTAFLARPTSSRVLLRQMIGRVLRGPRSGGDSVAHVVCFRDDFGHFADVLEPLDVLPTPPVDDRISLGEEELAGIDLDLGPERLPVLRTDDDQQLPAGVIGELERMNRTKYSVQPFTAPLAGWYDLGYRQVACYEHQRSGFEHLSLAIQRNERMSDRLSFFDDCPDPVPSRRSLNDFDKAVRGAKRTPRFIEVRDRTSPGDVARRVRAAGPMTEDQRYDFIRRLWLNAPARLAHPNIEGFVAAVDEEVGHQGRLARARSKQPDNIETRYPTERLRLVNRSLEPRLKAVRRFIEDRLGMEMARNLADLPPLLWSSKPVGSYFGVYVRRRTGRNPGPYVIRINRVLSTTRQAVPDEMLEYVIYHEVLHHLLPMNGHDSVFVSHEAVWPGAAQWDRDLDMLSQRYESSP